MRSIENVWFRVKRHGYGVGLPVAWQGWLMLVLYAGAIVFSAVLFSKPTSLAVVAILTPLVVFIAYKRSDEEWRWRNDG
ncbi:MAG: hypothetical protein WA954_12250 [Parerythrobacter sp.]